MDKEIWKDIPGFEGKYVVSNLGFAKSLKRRIGNGKGYFIPETMLKLINDKAGYKQISIPIGDRKNKKFVIHRLVARLFINDKIPPGAQICHKDGNKENNRFDNLYIGNSETNTIDKYLHGSTKLTIEQTKQIRIIAGQMSQYKIAEMFDVKPSTISKIINRKRGVFIR